MRNSRLKLAIPFIVALLLIAGFATLNLLALSLENQYSLRIDMTEDELFTLSDQSRGIIDNLNQNISIYAVYFRGNEDELVLDLLSMYGAASDKIFVQNVDPLTNTAFLSQFGSTGVDVQDGGVIVTNADASSYRTVSNEDIYETDEWGNVYATNAEMKITSAINVVTGGGGKSVRFLTGHRETELLELEGLTDSLEAVNFEVSTIDIVSEEPDPHGDILVSISPKSDFTDEELSAVDRFLDAGGTLIILMDGIIYDRTDGSIRVIEESQSNIEELLLEYGMRVEDNIVVGRDRSATSLRPTTFEATLINHPITDEIIYGGESVVLSEVAEITLTSSDAQVSTLAISPYESFAKPIENLDRGLEYDEDDKTGEFCLGAISTKTGSIVLFSSSSFVTNDEIHISGNMDVFPAVCTYASPEMPVLNIPVKSLLSDELDISNDFATMMLALLLDIVLPCAVVMVGVRITLKRKKI